MPLAFYMDHHVPLSISAGLRIRGVDVLTAYEDGAQRLSDPALLDRALVLQRVLFTRDDDFLVEAARRHQVGIPFFGLVYAHQLRASIGLCIEQLQLISELVEPDEIRNQVLFLPL
jgi:predicted nuclease of predicted toxin-antitoxin system